MKDTILAIAGRPGLYRLVSQGRNMLIVESIDADHRRISAGVRDRVTSLNDVSMYTEEEDKPLMDILQAVSDKLGGKPVEFNYRKAAAPELNEFFASVLPNFDRDRVHTSDIKKLIQWYNILVEGGITEFVDKAEEAAEAPAEEAAPAEQAAPAAEEKSKAKKTTRATKAKATTKKEKAE